MVEPSLRSSRCEQSRVLDDCGSLARQRPQDVAIHICECARRNVAIHVKDTEQFPLSGRYRGIECFNYWQFIHRNCHNCVQLQTRHAFLLRPAPASSPVSLTIISRRVFTTRFTTLCDTFNRSGRKVPFCASRATTICSSPPGLASNRTPRSVRVPWIAASTTAVSTSSSDKPVPSVR